MNYYSGVKEYSMVRLRAVFCPDFCKLRRSKHYRNCKISWCLGTLRQSSFSADNSFLPQTRLILKWAPMTYCLGDLGSHREQEYQYFRVASCYRNRNKFRPRESPVARAWLHLLTCITVYVSIWLIRTKWSICTAKLSLKSWSVVFIVDGKVFFSTSRVAKV